MKHNRKGTDFREDPAAVVVIDGAKRVVQQSILGLGRCARSAGEDDDGKVLPGGPGDCVQARSGCRHCTSRRTWSLAFMEQSASCRPSPAADLLLE